MSVLARRESTRARVAKARDARASKTHQDSRFTCSPSRHQHFNTSSNLHSMEHVHKRCDDHARTVYMGQTDACQRGYQSRAKAAAVVSWTRLTFPSLLDRDCLPPFLPIPLPLCSLIFILATMAWSKLLEEDPPVVPYVYKDSEVRRLVAENLLVSS